MRCGYPCTGTSALHRMEARARQLIEAIKAKISERFVMADCATIDEGIVCVNAGADFIGIDHARICVHRRHRGCDDIDLISSMNFPKMPGKDHRRGTYPLSEQAKKALEAGALHW